MSYASGETHVKYIHGHCGKKKSKPYWAWHAMIQRCTTENDKRYHEYGGRGIYVCARWKLFNNFLTDIGVAPKGFTLDRANNNKGYYKSNCRWVTNQVNAQNRNTTKLNANKVREIKKLRNDGMLIKDIAVKFGIGETCCGNVLRGSSWGNIK